jgi:3-hydroxy acid dehydrogenase / malonic semialdehyde reductase
MKHTKEQPLCALVTGASSGIGQATAQALAQLGYRLVICGRNESALNTLARELSTLTEVQSLVFDVSDKSEVQKAINSLPEPWASIDILINNAGNAHGLDPIQAGDSDDWDAMIDSNIKGVLYVTQAVLPQMQLRRSTPKEMSIAPPKLLWTLWHKESEWTSMERGSK